MVDPSRIVILHAGMYGGTPGQKQWLWKLTGGPGPNWSLEEYPPAEREEIRTHFAWVQASRDAYLEVMGD